MKSRKTKAAKGTRLFADAQTNYYVSQSLGTRLLRRSLHNQITTLTQAYISAGQIIISTTLPPSSIDSSLWTVASITQSFQFAMSAALRVGTTVQRISARGFHTSRPRLSGPHYPEGPTHNIPWTPKGKWNIRLKLFSYYGNPFNVFGKC